MTTRKAVRMAKVKQPDKLRCDSCGMLDGDPEPLNAPGYGPVQVTPDCIAGVAGKHKKGDLCQVCREPLEALYAKFKGRPMGRRTSIRVTDPRAITPKK